MTFNQTHQHFSLENEKLPVPANTAKLKPTRVSPIAKRKNNAIDDLIDLIFRNLQLDPELGSKGLFDLIDHCELLYERSLAENGLNDYIKGYLIFNYFINSFIMLHFGGFDKFIESNEQDFIIYLNVFYFYNKEESIYSYDQTIDLHRIRDDILAYLIAKNLLTFNVEDLYQWLNEYIEYLKHRDEHILQSQSPVETNIGYALNSSSESLLSNEETYNDRRNSLALNLSEFNNRYPSVNLNNRPRQTTIPRETIPPVRESYSTQRPAEIDSVGYHTQRPRKEPPSGTHQSPLNGSKSGIPYPIIDKFDNVPASTPYPLKTDILENDISKKLAEITIDPYHRPPLEIKKSTAVAIPSNVHATYDNYSENQYQNLYNKSVNNGSPSNGALHLKHTNPNGIYQDNSYNNTQHYSYPRQHPQVYGVPTQPVPPLPVPVTRNHDFASYGVCGLRNFGSSCYINLSIQLLFGIEDLKAIFKNRDYHKYIKDPKYQSLLHHYVSNGSHKDSLLLSDAVSGLLKTFNQNGGSSIAPTKFIRVASILKPDFNIPNEQQDAQEFLLFVLERLHDEFSEKIQLTDASSGPILEDYISKWNIEVNPNDKPEYLKWYRTVLEHEGKSPIHDLFQGHLQNKLRCNQCGYESITYSPFTSLSLPIPSSQNQQVNLADCLRYYNQDEVLSGENAWNCPKCSKNSPHVNALDNHPVFTPKKSGIFRLGKRSKSPIKDTKPKVTRTAIKSNSSSTKSLTFIKLPQVLFIQLARFSIYNLTDKLDTVIQYPLELKFYNHSHEIKYKLAGIINHYGNLKSGHYTALVNKSTINQHFDNNMDNLINPFWCVFDDEAIRTNIPHGSVTNPAMNQIYSRDVYVLCYERIS